MTQQDRLHLKWIYDRIIHSYDENEGVDYMRKFRSILEQLEKDEVEEIEFNRKADEAIKETEDARGYLIAQGVDPDEVGKQGATFVRVLSEKMKLEERLSQVPCNLRFLGQTIYGTSDAIQAVELLIGQRDQAWRDNKEIREMLEADENESTVDEVQSLLLNYRRAKDQMYKVRAIIDGCADEFTELVNLVRPGESENNSAKEEDRDEEVNLLAGLLKEASQEIKNLPELVKIVLTDGIKIRVTKNEDGEIQLYSNLPGKYFDVGGYVKEFAEAQNLHRID